MPTARNLFVNIESNSLDADTIYNLRKNGADTALTVTVGAGLTGFFEDIVNTDDYVEDDLLNYETDASASTVGTILCQTIKIEANTPSSNVWQMSAGVFGVGQAQGLTRFEPMVGAVQAHATESRAQSAISSSITWDRLGIRIITNTMTVASNVVSRIDSVDGNQTVSIAAGLTGYFEDLVNTDDLLTTEQVNFEIETLAGVGTLTYTILSSRINGSPTTQILQTNSATMTSAGFMTFPSGDNVSAAPETEAQIRIRFDATWLLLTVQIYTNTQGAPASVVVARLASADGNQTVSIPAATTGEFQDAVNTDDLVPGAVFDWNETGGNNMNWTGHIQSTLEPDADNQVMICSGADSTAFGVTEFNALMGRLLGTLTEANAQTANPNPNADFFTARKYSLPEVGSNFAQRYDSDSKKYPIPISLLTAQKYRSSARKYPRTTS